MVNYKYYSILLSSFLVISSFSYSGPLSNDIKKEMEASLLRAKIILTSLGAAGMTYITINSLMNGTTGLDLVITGAAIAINVALLKKWIELTKKRMELRGYESFIGYLFFQNN